MPAPKKGKRTKQRSMEYMREEGGIVANTEHWNPFARLRQDLFGFIDCVWLLDGRIIGVQVVNTKLLEHIDKIKENSASRAWMHCGGLIQIHNWKQRGPKGKKKWELQIINVL